MIQSFQRDARGHFAATARLFTVLPALALLGVAIPPAAAQDADLQAIRREMTAMRQRYDAQYQALKRDYEARLSDLDQRLAAAEKSAASATAAAQAATQAAAQPAAAPAPVAAAAPPPDTAAANPTQSASAFNPAIGVILDGTFARYGRNPNTYKLPGFPLGGDVTPAPRGFGLGESEVNFTANVDQAALGNLTLAFHPDNTVSVEEGFVQSTSLPWGVTAKAGRFFSGIGYLNEQHSHTWDFVDQPLPYKAFLNNQLGDDGLQMRWVAPTDIFVEFGGEGFRGDQFPAANAANNGVGQYSTFAHVGDDIGDSASYRVGVSYLHSDPRNRLTGTDTFSGGSGLKIIDAVYKWSPNGNPTQQNLKLQAEYMWRDESGLFDSRTYKGSAQGWYAQGVYQFMQGWRVGYRYDWLRGAPVPSFFTGTTLDTGGITSFRNSMMVDYSTSEFGRYRLNFIRDDSQRVTDNQIILQYTVSLGSHGAHQF